ncbi:MAG TPA: 30S ribosomal protein S16 [Egibacteraceae bacterium]|jgi:small subunit ribosomal protein S16|nr:30S ribosomal protein S16 [Egibacteraceae bacterium]
MAVKIRLRREGKKKQPYYRVVVADVRAPRDGRFIDDIGYYQPLHEPSTISIDRERALKWLRNGAQPTDAVVNLLRIEGIWEEFRPGDPGKDRSAKRDALAAKAAERENEARRRAEAAARERAEAEASAAAEATPTDPDEATVAQAREEVTQPDPLPAEDAGALPPEEGGQAPEPSSAEGATTEEEQP